MIVNPDTTFDRTSGPAFKAIYIAIKLQLHLHKHIRCSSRFASCKTALKNPYSMLKSISVHHQLR